MRTASFAGVCCLLLIALLLPEVAQAKVQTIPMRGDYSDYAIHPETGDLVALTETGEALLFRAEDLEAGNSEPAAKLRVGSSPCSVFYKQFGDKKVFAVVCSQDSHMFLINAGDFTLLKKLELSQSGVSNVTGSIKYYVLAEVSSSELQERLKQLDDQRRKQLEEQQKKFAERPLPMRVRPGAVEEGADDPAALRRRIEALEQRLDLMTRQLNEVLKKLDR